MAGAHCRCRRPPQLSTFHYRERVNKQTNKHRRPGRWSPSRLDPCPPVSTDPLLWGSNIHLLVTKFQQLLGGSCSGIRGSTGQLMTSEEQKGRRRPSISRVTSSGAAGLSGRRVPRRSSIRGRRCPSLAVARLSLRVWTAAITWLLGVCLTSEAESISPWLNLSPGLDHWLIACTCRRARLLTKPACLLSDCCLT